MSRPIPPHGHPNRYAAGCRCEPCTKAASRADAERRLDRLAGRPRMVPAGPAAEHARQLVNQGLTFSQIDRESGVQASTVRRLLDGQLQIRRTTADKILRVPLKVRVTLGDVPACGAIRRVRALYALGHFNREIALVAGVSRDTIGYLAAGKWLTLRVSADDGIRAAYDQMSMRAGTSWKTRGLAVRSGWVPPLAWDEDTIDDPSAEPVRDLVQVDDDEDFVDPVAVQRFVAGAPVDVTDAEWLVALKECVARGMSYPQVDELRGAEKGTTEKAVNRLRKAYTRAGRELPEALRPTKVGTFGDRQVVEIRERYAAGGTSDLELSMRYGVSRETITSLLSGATYRAAGGPIRQKRSSRPVETSRIEFNGHTGFGLAGPAAQAS